MSHFSIHRCKLLAPTFGRKPALACSVPFQALAADLIRHPVSVIVAAGVSRRLNFAFEVVVQWRALWVLSDAALPVSLRVSRVSTAEGWDVDAGALSAACYTLPRPLRYRRL